MLTHCPSPHSDHRLVLATSPDSIDNGDLTLATLTRFDQQFLRTAQVSAQIDENRLKILHLQGAGPRQSYRRAGADPKTLFEKFHRDTGLKPINTLLAALALEARHLGFRELVWAGSDDFHLRPKAILNAMQFREDAEGILRLHLDTPEKKIMRRLTGNNLRKQAVFRVLRDCFHELLKKF